MWPSEHRLHLLIPYRAARSTVSQMLEDLGVKQKLAEMDDAKLYRVAIPDDPTLETYAGKIHTKLRSGLNNTQTFVAVGLQHDDTIAHLVGHYYDRPVDIVFRPGEAVFIRENNGNVIEHLIQKISISGPQVQTTRTMFDHDGKPKGQSSKEDYNVGIFLESVVFGPQDDSDSDSDDDMPLSVLYQQRMEEDDAKRLREEDDAKRLREEDDAKRPRHVPASASWRMRAKNS